MKDFDKVSKIPYSLADARNIIDIIIKKNKLILKYELSSKFSDEVTSITEFKEIIIEYKRKIKKFEVQVDEEDNLIIGVVYKPPFSLFGWVLQKEEV